MTKTQSLLNAATLANRWEITTTLEPRWDKHLAEFWKTMESVAEECTRNYARADISTWSDSAGNSISARVGDYHVVSFWDGEDMLFIYQCKPDDEVSEVIGHDPIFSQAL